MWTTFYLLVLYGSQYFVSCQNDDFINADFLEMYEEVTQAPLVSFGALPRCGEGNETNRFLCVPYYNCEARQLANLEPNLLDGTNNGTNTINFNNVLDLR